jgi:cytochrome c-type biogenesis protein
MNSELLNLGLAGSAGILSTLSPCVLPILPIVLAGARNSHRFGMPALIAGLAAAFTAMGVLMATIGVALGLHGEHFRQIAAVILIILAVVMFSARLQQQFSTMTHYFGSTSQNWMQRITNHGWLSQLALGATLGFVWSPCVGPTLGTAITLASQGEGLIQATLVMLMFSLGASLPLLVLGLMSRQLLQRVKGRLVGAGQIGKRVLATTLLIMGICVLAGTDKQLEAFLVMHSPDWLTDVSTL